MTALARLERREERSWKLPTPPVPLPTLLPGMVTGALHPIRPARGHGIEWGLKILAKLMLVTLK